MNVFPRISTTGKPVRSRTAPAARSCGTCPPPSSGSRRRTRTRPGARTWRSSGRGTRAAPRRVAVLPSRQTQTASGRSSHFSCGIAITAASAIAGMRHQRVLEVDRGDPLAARLDHVLRAVLDHHVALRVERGDVAGLEPAVLGPALGLLGRVVVGGRDPRAAHLELAHRLAVPRDLLAVVADRAQLHERKRQALHRDHVELGLLVRRPEVADVVGGGRERRRLGHPPAVHDRLAVALPEARDHRPRRGRAADEHVLELLEVPAVRLRVEHAEDPHPDRRHAGRDRDALLLEVVEQRLGIEEGAGEDDLRPDHQARVGVAPRVGVEHRHDRQQRLRLGHVQPERRDERLAERVQDRRAVRVEDALRHPGRAARVAHRRRRVLVELRILVRRPGRRRRAAPRSESSTTKTCSICVLSANCSQSGSSDLSTIRALSPACVAM